MISQREDIIVALKKDGSFVEIGSPAGEKSKRKKRTPQDKKAKKMALKLVLLKNSSG